MNTDWVERETRLTAELIQQEEARARADRAARLVPGRVQERLQRRSRRERGSSALVLLVGVPALALVLLVMVKIAAVLSAVAAVGGVQ